MTSHVRARLVTLAAAIALASAWSVWPVSAQGPVKRPLSYDVYDSWRSIQGTELSRDGQWLAYALTSSGADGELVVRNLQTDTELRHPRGTNPQFTPDGRFVLFTIVPPRAEDEAEEGGGGRAGGRGGRGGRGGGGGGNGVARNALGIMTLPGGEVTTVEQVRAFRLPAESSTWVAIHKGRPPGNGNGRNGRGGRAGGGEPPAAGQTAQAGQAGQAEGEADDEDEERSKDPGTDLVLRNLATGDEATMPNVVEFAWDEDGTRLAYATSAEEAAGDGVFVRAMGDGEVTTLMSGRGHYSDLAFDEAGEQLAFLSDQAEYAEDVAPYRLYYWRVGQPNATELVSATTAGMPEGMVVSDNASPRFTEDGRVLQLGTAPRPEPEDEDAPDPIAVDLWHYQDGWLQPMQAVRANQERNRTYTAVVHLADRRFVPLATPEVLDVAVGSDPGRFVLGRSDLPYRQEVSWDQTYSDIHLVDVSNGRSRQILERWGANASLSTGGAYVLYFDEVEGDWWTYRVSDGRRANLTEGLDVSFQDEKHDSPSYAGSYGTAGWTDDDRSVLLYDRYDIWEVRPDGSNARMVTQGSGREQQLVYRYRAMDPDRETVPSDEPFLVSITNDVTKAQGFGRTTLAAASAPSPLIMLDKSLGNPTKARDADVVVFTQSTFSEFPNLWVSDTDFTSPRKVSDANPQQAEFVWGNAELIDYWNADGTPLRAMLIKPDNFDPTKKYPLMVYIYEELTQGLHSYRSPNVGTSINLTRYVSNGYVVLQPDIVYEDGYPGESAEKCVIPAVNTVVDMGFIDPERIGIQGHSWGGYQITHLITRTNMFAAVEAGAPVANMISAYGGIRWGTGMSRAFQYEKTQSRIGAPPWEMPLQFIENSPIFWVDKVETPYLTIHNDEDDAVPWYQGIEFFNALRRLGKEAYFFNYNGERHGLRNRDNQKHWTVHMDEFFDHYLLGTPKPEWMETGVPYLQRGRRDVSKLFEAETVDPANGGRRR